MAPICGAMVLRSFTSRALKLGPRMGRGSLVRAKEQQGMGWWWGTRRCVHLQKLVAWNISSHVICVGANCFGVASDDRDCLIECLLFPCYTYD